MRNNMFSGWSNVFHFTIKQGANQKYKAITAVFAVILLAVSLVFNIVSALGQKKDDNISPIDKVYVIDDSQIDGIDWKDSKKLDREKFPEVSFELTSRDIKGLAAELEKKNVIASVSKAKDSYKVCVLIPYDSEVTTDDGENLAKAIKTIVYEGMINTAAIDEEKVVYAVSGIITEFGNVGENAKSDNMLVITTVFPVVFMLGLYFMVIIYGQSMGQIVSIEKSTKLMESLLVMTRPYGIIFGKIIATSFLAIFQIAVWIVVAVVGFFVGDSLAGKLVYSGYENSILSMFKDIAADEAAKAFSWEAIVLTVIAVCLAFIFYCMLAGAISSFASKADELGTVMAFYNMFIVIGFLGSYILPATTGQGWINVILRLIPMSAAFLLPGELLLGTVQAGVGILYLIVLMAWIVVVAVFAGKIYKDQLFYNGQSLTERIPWLKKKKDDNSDEQRQILHDEAGRPIEKSQKIGYFFLAVSPIVIFLIIQLMASLVLTNIITRVDLRGIDLDTWEVKNFVDYYHGIEDLLNPLTVMVSHLLIITSFGIWMYFIRRGIDRNKIFHIDSLKNKLFVIIGICIVCGVGLSAFANGTVIVENAVMPSIVENYMEMADSAGFGKSPFAVIAAVCMAPIGEELLCRGVCMHFGKKSLGKFWYANILQAALFGALHMNWVQGIYAFFIGLVLGILVERYNSLLPGMFVHFVVNLSASTWGPKVFGKVEMNLGNGIALVVIPAIAVAAILYFVQKSKSNEEQL